LGVRSVIIYANSKGCAKCLKNQLELGHKYNNNNKVTYLLNFYTLNEIIAAKNEYSLGKKIYWDNENNLDQLLNVDLKKTYPLVLYVKKGLIIKYKFVKIDSQEGVAEVVGTINSYIMGL
jgi:adenylate kinase family enzyme